MTIDWFPLWLSLRVAFISTAMALAAGLWIAYLLGQSRISGEGGAGCGGDAAAGAASNRAGLLLAGGHRPQESPRQALGTDVRIALVFTWKAAVVAALLHSLPLLVNSARAAFESVDRSL